MYDLTFHIGKLLPIIELAMEAGIMTLAVGFRALYGLSSYLGEFQFNRILGLGFYRMTFPFNKIMLTPGYEDSPRYRISSRWSPRNQITKSTVNAALQDENLGRAKKSLQVFLYRVNIHPKYCGLCASAHIILKNY